MDVVRARGILAELSWHGESHRLLQETGVDEGELARAAEVAVAFIDAHIGRPRDRDEAPSPRRV